LKETLLQTEMQEHDGTKKLLKESREKNEEILDKMKELDKRSNRMQDNIKRFANKLN
jgi:pyruvate-formate lyase